jgi:hypothetical protein
MSKDDPYHNEFFDSGEMFMDEFVKNLRESGLGTEVSEEALEAERRNESNQPIIKRAGTARSLQDIASDKLDSGTGNYISDKVIIEAENAKEYLIEAYSQSSGNKGVCDTLERCIARIERLQSMIGAKVEKFDPARHKTGLSMKDPLENTNRVIKNTLEAYDLFTIFNISSLVHEGQPVIKLSILGESNDKGFVINAAVLAKDDFTGSEAIDYVYSDDGGLITVKSFVRSSWRDVSSNFKVEFNVEEYDLKKLDNHHSVFVGEQIRKQGQGFFEEELNLKKGELRYGDYQVFTQDVAVANRIKGILKAKAK